LSRSVTTLGAMLSAGIENWSVRTGQGELANRLLSRDAYSRRSVETRRKQWLQVGLGCIQLSPSCPSRRLHSFRFLRPARLLRPAFGYGAPQLSPRGTLTLLNNALLSAHFRVADDSFRMQNWILTRCCKTLFSKEHKSRFSYARGAITAMDVRGYEESERTHGEL